MKLTQLESALLAIASSLGRRTEDTLIVDKNLQSWHIDVPFQAQGEDCPFFEIMVDFRIDCGFEKVSAYARSWRDDDYGNEYLHTTFFRGVHDAHKGLAILNALYSLTNNQE